MVPIRKHGIFLLKKTVLVPQVQNNKSKKKKSFAILASYLLTPKDNTEAKAEQ